jgi:hypothetical protein
MGKSKQAVLVAAANAGGKLCHSGARASLDPPPIHPRLSLEENKQPNHESN